MTSKGNHISKTMAKLLTGELKKRANSASCLFMYEMEKPAELGRFKKSFGEADDK